MKCTVQLKNESFIEINNFKMIKYPSTTQGYKEITSDNIDSLMFSDKITYTIIGDSTAIIKGEQILYFFFD